MTGQQFREAVSGEVKLEEQEKEVEGEDGKKEKKKVMQVVCNIATFGKLIASQLENIYVMHPCEEHERLRHASMYLMDCQQPLSPLLRLKTKPGEQIDEDLLPKSAKRLRRQ